MNQLENLIVTASEECSEIQQALSKALRFGLTNHHPDRPYQNNADEIIIEYYELSALITKLQESGNLPVPSDSEIAEIMQKKIANVAKWQEISFDCRTLTGQINTEEATKTSAKRVLQRLQTAGGCDAAISEAIRIVEDESGIEISEVLD